jgi:predicted ATPase
MSKIRVTNFGPIKVGNQDNDGWIDLKKVTVFIGNQGSGKSTMAKLVSTFTWIEKALVRGDYDKKWFKQKNKFRGQFLSYHRLENYYYDGLFDSVLLEYVGEAYHIKYESGELTINEVKGGQYPLPQIVYVPSERNFIANVKNAKALKLASDSLVEFLTEYDNAKNELKNSAKLPINNSEIDYDRSNDVVHVRGNGYRVRLTEASSGFQSFVPLYLVSWYLANSVRKQSEVTKEPMTGDELERFRKGVEDIWSNESLTDDQRRIALSVLSSKFNKTAFVNIVEEPEQNLFPSSQRQMLNSLLEFNNVNVGNRLIMTTHSPYMINHLSIAIQGGHLKNKIDGSDKSEALLKKLNRAIPAESVIIASDVAIYQMNETNGSISKLPDFEGIPSDHNFLNESLAEGNQLFDSLLEIEEEL